jgi:hypothetical protein
MGYDHKHRVPTIILLEYDPPAAECVTHHREAFEEKDPFLELN